MYEPSNKGYFYKKIKNFNGTLKAYSHTLSKKLIPNIPLTIFLVFLDNCGFGFDLPEKYREDFFSSFCIRYTLKHFMATLLEKALKVNITFYFFF